MATRSEVIQKIASLPYSVNWDTVMSSLHLQESLARSAADIEAGRVYSGDAARQRVRDLARQRHGCNVDR